VASHHVSPPQTATITIQKHSDSPFVVNNNAGGGFGALALVIVVR
jgi:hypothetical protein